MNGRANLCCLTLLAELLLTSALAADNLERRTYLGLQFDLSDQNGPGLLVQRVLPGSTAGDGRCPPGRPAHLRRIR